MIRHCIRVKTKQLVIRQRAMKGIEYEDISIATAKYLLKFTGVWLTENRSDEIKRKISISYMVVGHIYGIYLNILNIHYSWGDLNFCLFLITNTGCVCLTIMKLLTLSCHRTEFIGLVVFARKYFWHRNYNIQEQVFISQCDILCKTWVYLLYCVVPGCLAGYILPSVIKNIGVNTTDRVLPFREWTEIKETPYFELTFLFQAGCISIMGIAYVSCDTFMYILNMHVVCQFRILQHRLLKVWDAMNGKTDSIEYMDKCYKQLRRCVCQHQFLTEYCKMIENVYTLTVCEHLLVCSVLFSFHCYEIFLVDQSFIQKLAFICNLAGTFLTVVIFTYSCHLMMEESMQVTTTVYSGLWTTLPMTEIGRSLRKNVHIIMLRALKPCCVTAGGFFPVSLETTTALISTTLSYFTMIREATT